MNLNTPQITGTLKALLANGGQSAVPQPSTHDSDDHENEIINEVLKTHHPDGSKVDVKLLLDIIENILLFSNRCVNMLTV